MHLGYVHGNAIGQSHEACRDGIVGGVSSSGHSFGPPRHLFVAGACQTDREGKVGTSLEDILVDVIKARGELMTQNRHGHHIQGTSFEDDEQYREVVLCSGYPFCDECAEDKAASIRDRQMSFGKAMIGQTE
jgi:hypothetical protein